MEVPTTLTALADVYALVPFYIKLIGHCLVVSSWFRQPFLRERYMLSYWVGLFGAFGGGLLTAFLFQDPQRFGIALFADNTMGLTWTLCWWLMNYSPFDIAYKVHDILLVKMTTKALMNALRAGVIAGRVDVVVALYPGVYVAPLMIGTLAASGGKLCVDTIMALYGPKPSGPSEIAQPGFALRTGMFGSLTYWLAVHVFEVLKPREGGALLVTIFVAHGLASDLVGQPLDYTHPIAYVLHTLLLVPMPGAPAVKAARPAASKSTSATSKGGKSEAKKTK